jgi:hypothetical protein
MQALQQTKKHIFVPPGAVVDNATYTSNVIDCAGADYLEVDVIVGTTDVALATLKLQESDAKSSATALTTGADISGFVYGTSTDPDSGSTSALPADDKDNKVFQFRVPLQGRKRYINLIAVAGNGTTGTYLAAVGTLAKLEQGPTSATEAGLGAWL